MEVLIVAKTKWGTFYCIGGIEIQTKKFIRLMDLNGGYQPSNTQFKVGQIWNINYTSNPGKPPHVEDVRVSSATYVRTVSPNQYIINNFNIWKGDPVNLYTSKLKWENGKGFLNNPNNLPANSVGFWQSDKDLVFKNGYYTYNYNIPFKKEKQLPYKGTDVAIQIIPANTLIRVSLAKWWNKDQNTEARCYLQLSGWY